MAYLAALLGMIGVMILMFSGFGLVVTGIIDLYMHRFHYSKFVLKIVVVGIVIIFLSLIISIIHGYLAAS